ncbi:exported hypothetical protein [Paraburkholderia ribeironis]|uniref:Lysozyme inhibitor LprI N-terminal domain-containing protein n=1 Tax=Paraburkholderia ribeironis TaxID=1247936 RepID=A0A1N7S9D4_9BURK|nr:exported hypothetical protein [Paraburkholderia ribeironis]
MLKVGCLLPGIMMQLSKITLALVLICANAAALADGSCEAKETTRDDYLACTNADTKKILSDAERLYQNIRDN